MISILYFSGNAGGYLGLFLGYALLNIPDLIAFLVSLTKKWMAKRNKVDQVSRAEFIRIKQKKESCNEKTACLM